MKRRNFLYLFPALGLLACGVDERGFYNKDQTAQGIVPQASLFGGDGNAVSFEDFRGKALVVYFGYTNSPEMVPTAMRKYASLIRNLRSKDAERVQFLFISFDSERDTPALSNTYARLFNQGFTGLAADAPQIAALASQFGATYTKKSVAGSAAYHFEHSNEAYVVDPKGRLRLALAADALLEPITADLQKLLAEK
ncbi:MAG: SCO family protein [Betaproteobacteria bacterium HGW-Betaproteobacteria-7]|jgi:protein SCO1/2|nr:MAG: SCO family protein [Betaproteobacteria bacterium HGW-Betaproteobacteria-7]